MMSVAAAQADAILKALVSLADSFNAHDLDRIMSLSLLKTMSGSIHDEVRRGSAS
jgi:hypothetical protein